MLHSICQQIWKTQQCPEDWKRLIFIPIQKKSRAKECAKYCTIVLISHASRVMLKILQTRLQQYMNWELIDVRFRKGFSEFRKGRGTRGQIANIHWIIEKARAFYKNLYFCEPDILECKVRSALGRITVNKAVGGDGIPAELFQILKNDAVKVLHSICQQIWKTQQWPQDWKRSVFIPIPKKGNTKQCSNYHTIALISQASNVQYSPSQASTVRKLWT